MVYDEKIDVSISNGNTNITFVSVARNTQASMLLSGFQSQPFSFGEQALTDRMFYEQRLIAILVIFPLAMIVGQLSLRLCTRPLIPFLRSDIWNALIRLVIADIAIELLQNSLGCVPFEEESDLKELVLQSLGYGCPLYARALDPRGTGLVFGLRFVAMALGIFFGEGWMPIAITGGVATGKSTVSLQLVEGKEVETALQQSDDNVDAQEPKREDPDGGSVYLVDTDKIGHSILLESTAGNVHNKLVTTFGEGILDEEGVIDRKKLGSIVFEDASLRRKLNQITHPRIVSKMLQKILWGLFASGADMTVAEIPLFFEAGFFTRCLFCLSVCVSCSPEQELQRLMSRNPELSKAECQARIDSQMPLAKKVKMADIVIHNNGDKQSLAEEVEKAREQLMWRLYGVGLTLFQIVAIMGVSLPVAIFVKLYRNQQATAA